MSMAKEMGLEDGAATTWTASSQEYERDVKKRFVGFIEAYLPEIQGRVIKHSANYQRNVYVIDIAEFKRILVAHNAYPEGQGKNYGLLEWAMSNKEYLQLMLL